MDTATTTAIAATLAYALTGVAKRAGLPDKLVRPFVGFVALALPIGLAWHGGTLHSFDWNNNLLALYDASWVLITAVTTYFAATGVHESVKDATKS